MAVRLLFTIADNEGHLLSMRYLALSPFPPSNGDQVDPSEPKTHFFQFAQAPQPSATSSLLDQLAGRRTHHGTPTMFVPGWRSLHACPQTDRLAATVPDLRRRRQDDAAVRANLAYNWKVSLKDLTPKVPGATTGFRPSGRVPGVPTRCTMSHESQFDVPPETEWDD
jgi:hypothetical protein